MNGLGIVFVNFIFGTLPKRFGTCAVDGTQARELLVPAVDCLTISQPHNYAFISIY